MKIERGTARRRTPMAGSFENARAGCRAALPVGGPMRSAAAAAQAARNTPGHGGIASGPPSVEAGRVLARRTEQPAVRPGCAFIPRTPRARTQGDARRAEAAGSREGCGPRTSASPRTPEGKMWSANPRPKRESQVWSPTRDSRRLDGMGRRKPAPFVVPWRLVGLHPTSCTGVDPKAGAPSTPDAQWASWAREDWLRSYPPGVVAPAARDGRDRVWASGPARSRTAGREARLFARASRRVTGSSVS